MGPLHIYYYFYVLIEEELKFLSYYPIMNPFYYNHIRTIIFEITMKLKNKFQRTNVYSNMHIPNSNLFYSMPSASEWMGLGINILSHRYEWLKFNNAQIEEQFHYIFLNGIAPRLIVVNWIFKWDTCRSSISIQYKILLTSNVNPFNTRPFFFPSL